MSTIFILDTNNQTPPAQLLERIKGINPDKIIIDCETEGAAEVIFNDLFNVLDPWLKETGKVINVLTPHLNNIHIRDTVIGEQGYGMLLHSLGSMIMNRPDQFPPTEYRLPSSAAPYFGNLNEKHFEVLYTCYNNNVPHHRGLMIDTLAREGLLTKGIVTLHHPERYEWKYHDGSKLFDESDYAIHSAPQYNPEKFPRSFHKGFFDIVGESQYDRIHLTEKTLKSITMFKPFLINGGKGFHNEYLFDFIGLKPYTELFDYSFDSCTLIDDRVEGIIDNVKRLSNLTLPERQQLYKDIIPKLVYNKSKMIETLYDKKKIVPKSLQCLMDGNTHHVYGYSYILLHMQQMGWIKENVTWVT
jgi:hypothetical protein